MTSTSNLRVPTIILTFFMLIGCAGPDDEVQGGQTSAGDSSGNTDGGGTLGDAVTLPDGAPAILPDGAIATLPDGAPAILPDGAAAPVKDASGTAPGKDGGTAPGKDGGTTPGKDGGTTPGKDTGTTPIQDGGVTPGKDAAKGPPDLAGDKDKKYQTCPELLTCAQVACQYDPKPNCESICTDNGAWAAKQDFEPFSECMWGKCFPAKCKDAAKPEECVKQCYGVCAGLLYTCMAEGKTGNAKCSTAWSCMEACEKPGQDNFMCNVECYKKMSGKSQEQFNKAFACISDQQGGGDNPMLGCMDQLLACAADGGVGTGTCDDVLQCAGKCDKGLEDFICSGKCYAKGSAKAQKQFSDVYDCYGAADANKTDPSECMKTAYVCSSGGSTGKGSCVDVVACASKCDKGLENASCTGKCYGKGTAAAQKQFVDAYSCYGSAAAKGSGPIACTDETIKCANPSGELYCLKIWPCIQECSGGKDDSGYCSFKCLHEASPKEATAWVNLVMCTEGKCNEACKNEPEGDKKQACKNKCSKEQCSAQTKACLG